MNGLEAVGRILLILGGITAGLGLLILLAARLPFLGNLPGTIRLEGEQVTLIVPLGLMIIVSVVLTVVLNVIFRGR
jgi:hypothetical protein